MFKAIAWSPEATHNKIMFFSVPRWVSVKNMQPKMWFMLPRLFKFVGTILQIEKSRVTLPHLDARILVSFHSRVKISDAIELEFDGKLYKCEIEALGGLNSCFLCKTNGHQKRDFSRLVNRKNNGKPSRVAFNNHNEIKNLEEECVKIELSNHSNTLNPRKYPTDLGFPRKPI